MLQDCGLYVNVAPSRRVYFAPPHTRPQGPNDQQKCGTCRQPVTAPCPYLRSVEDEEDKQDGARPKAYVQSATHEQSMGAGATKEFEVPLPEDDDALECPDKGTKVEWDAIGTAEHCLKRASLGPTAQLRVDPERLRWLTPEREGAGGLGRERLGSFGKHLHVD